MTLLYSPTDAAYHLHTLRVRHLNAVSGYNKLSPIRGEDNNSLTYIQRAS